MERFRGQYAISRTEVEDQKIILKKTGNNFLIMRFILILDRFTGGKSVESNKNINRFSKAGFGFDIRIFMGVYSRSPVFT